MPTFWKITTFLLAASFFGENMGFFTHQMNLAIGFLCLIAFSLLYFPSIDLKNLKKTKIDWVWAAIGLAAIILAVVLLRDEILLRMAGLCVFVFGLDSILRSLGRQERELPVMLVTMLGFTLSLLIYQYTPFLWYGMNSFSLFISKSVSNLVHEDVLLGVTFMGLWSTMLFAWFFISSYIFSVGKKPWHLVVFLVALLVANVLYIVLFAYVPSLVPLLKPLLKDQPIEAGAPIPERYFLNLPIILFLFLLIPLSVYIGRVQYRAMSLPLQKANLKWLIPCLVLLAFSVGSVAISFPVKFVPDRDVVFYEKGFLNWETPDYESFGSRSSGMFGNLPSLVDKMGLKSRRISQITEESLSGAKVLALINLKEELSQSEVETTWEFVKDGGSLLVLGDHTFYGQDETNWLNEVLKPVNIEYNFDSADFFIGGWLHSYEFAEHPITHNIGDVENEPGIVVGASLKTQYPAVPLIFGKYGYSDIGNQHDPDRGYLGDLEYEMSEQIGDVVLAAEQRYGNGKVLVFGDTSGFANSILINSYTFVNRVFNWLASDNMPKAHIVRLILFLVFLAAAVVIFLLFKVKKSVIMLLLSALVIVLVVASAGLVSVWKIERPLTGGKIAYVDASHFGRFSQESWRDDGTMGLHLNLMRNGYLSFFLKDLSRETISYSDLLVFIAPTKPFSKSDVKMLKEYVEGGGRLILTVGWEEKDPSLPLLEAFNFRIEEIPLGFFKVPVPDAEEWPHFWEGWPVYSEDDKAQVVCTYQEEYPLINIKDYGKGKFVVIGDSNFFLNKNLEMEDQPVEESISFLKWLLNKLQPSIQLTRGG